MTNTVNKSLAWSAFGEIAAKLIGPVTTILLAHILTPNDFGVIALCNMILFFCEIIVDAGFGKYLVQGSFDSKKELMEYASTAFWTNFIVALLIWLIIILSRYPISTFFDKPEYSDVIAVATGQMVIVSIISTQLGLLRREFRFKELSYVRIIASCVPLAITVPIAYFYRSYWAMVIGTYCSYLCQSAALAYLLRWKPDLMWSYAKLKRMFSFSFWSLLEGLAHWLIFWVDVFILTKLYSAYYVGLYKNSSSIIMSMFLMVASSVMPVLFSTLSRIKDSSKSFDVVLRIERLVLYIICPAATILWFCRTIITDILLGHQWTEASLIVGYWGIIMALSIAIYSFPAEAFKSMGKPKYLFFYQLSYLLILVPLCWWGASKDFWTFVNIRFYCVAAQIVLFVIFAKSLLHWSISKFFSNWRNPIIIVIGLILLNFVIDVYSKDIYIFIANCLLAIFTLVVFKNDIKRLIGTLNLDPSTSKNE